MRSLTCVCVVLMLGGCCLSKPFVDDYSGSIFNKQSHSLKDGVQICFYQATPEELQEMADRECQKINRHAIYEKTTDFSCSVIAPSKAFFKCQ